MGNLKCASELWIVRSVLIAIYTLPWQGVSVKLSRANTLHKQQKCSPADEDFLIQAVPVNVQNPPGGTGLLSSCLI